MIEYTVEVYDNGDKEWRLNGLLHREDGPALEYADGSKSWYLNGELHREDGPAHECNGYKAWWLKGEKVTEEEHKKRTSETTCEGKVVEIDGVKYELKEV